MQLPAGDVFGIGIDVLELSRFHAFLARNEEHLSEIFTRRELTAADASRRRDLYLATRWALKEAVLKALGTGWEGDVEWTDVEAVGGLFEPRIVLRGVAKQVAEQSGASRAVASASSGGDCVMALVALTAIGHCHSG
jgi:holo-[acyl-carrier protein] synthase